MASMECINRMLWGTSKSTFGQPDYTCLNQHFPELCDLRPISNEQWIVYTSGCNIITHSTKATELSKQVISIGKCQTIYKCWLVFDNIMVCLYLSSKHSQTTAKRLRLYILYAQQGSWTKSNSQSVFTFHARIGTISSSVALRQAIDDEKGRIAEFFIGNDQKYLTVRLLLDELGSPPESRYLTVCKTSQVVQVSQAGTNKLIIFCESQIMQVNLKARRITDITPLALSNTALYSAQIFFSKSGGTAFLTITSQGNTTNCFIFLDVQHTSSRCEVVQNASNTSTVTDGAFIDEQSLGLLDNTTINIMNVTFDPLATITNVCPTSNCYLYQTDRLLYFYDQRSTTVFDKRTYDIVTAQSASIGEVLPKLQRAIYNCIYLIVPTTTTTTAIIPISSTGMGSGSQPFVPSNTDVISTQNSISFATADTVFSTAKATVIATTSTNSRVTTSTSTPCTSFSHISSVALATGHGSIITTTITLTSSSTSSYSTVMTTSISTQPTEPTTVQVANENSPSGSDTKIIIIVPPATVLVLLLLTSILVLVFCWSGKVQHTQYQIRKLVCSLESQASLVYLPIHTILYQHHRRKDQHN